MADIFWPFSTTTVSEWPGARGEGWADHVGTDFAVPQGTPLRATIAGTVDIIWNDGLGAWVIDIIAPDGTVARHGHLSYMHPHDGAWVNAGDYIGNTGGAYGTAGAGLSTGAHLHWELRNNRGWGAWGWYDPRNLTIRSFDAPPITAPALTEQAPKRKKMHNMFMVRYKNGNPKGGTGWLVVGAPKPEILVTMAAARGILDQWGAENSYETDKGGWLKFLRMSGMSAEDISALNVK